MYEIEAKVWVKSDQEWQALFEEIKKLAQFKKEEKKEDLYFGLINSNKALFRLRTINNKKHEVTTKKKKIIDGVEQSKEESFLVDNKKTFITFTKKLGLTILLQKTKQSIVYVQKDLYIELNTIKNLGNFLEIETLCQDKQDVPLANAKILSIFTTLGFTKQDFEKKTYMQLFQENSAKQA